MIIAVLKEGSAGLLPLSGAAPAIYLGGWKGRRKMKGSRGNNASDIIAQIISMSVQETSEVVFTLAFFNTKFSKRGKVS